MGAPMLWWLTVGLLVAAELATGTFYLLMLALGAGAGATAAHMGLNPTAQVVVAAVLGGVAVVGWELKRRLAPKTAPAESNRDVNLDIGETVHVPAWLPDGTARVSYRGAGWAVRYAGNGTPVPGNYRIQSMHGSELRVAPAGN